MLCCYNKRRDNRCLLPRFQDDLFCEEHRKREYNHIVQSVDNPLPLNLNFTLKNQNRAGANPYNMIEHERQIATSSKPSKLEEN